MYNDDKDIVECARSLNQARESMKVLRRQEEVARSKLLAIMEQAGTNLLTTDEFIITKAQRTMITIDRRVLETEYPEAFADVAVIGNNNVITVQRR